MRLFNLIIPILMLVQLCRAGEDHGLSQPAKTPAASERIIPLGSKAVKSSSDDIVLSESFDEIPNGQLPGGWTIADGDAGYSSWFNRASTWQVYSSDVYPAHSGASFVMCHFNDAALPNDDWLILPRQNLSGQITLSYWAASQDNQYPESFEIRVSTGGNQPANFSQLVQSVSAVPGAWTPYTHDLTPYADAPFWLAFHYNAADRFVLKIDDVVIDGIPAPTGAITGTVTDDSGRAVSQAYVIIPSIGDTVRTSADGRYELAGLVPGTYLVRFYHEYYYGEIRPGIQVEAGGETNLDVELPSRLLIFHDYVSMNSPRTIADFDTAAMPLFNVIFDTLIIYDIDASATIEHTYVGDLDIWLSSPDSITVRLAEHNPNNSGVNLTDCRFDDEAELAYSQGLAPYNGHWRPHQTLSVYDGDSTLAIRGTQVRRTWYLYVHDTAEQDEGRITGFAIHVVSQAPVSAGNPRPGIPDAFRFEGCYPNPFNGMTQFRFSLPRSMPVELVLYDLLGRQAAKVIRKTMSAGDHIVTFSADHLPSGVYIARLSTPAFSAARKTILLK